MPILVEIIGQAALADRIARALDGSGPFRARACDLACPAPSGGTAPDFLLFLRDGAQEVMPAAKEEER